MSDSSPPFLRIDREQGGASRHYVVHAADPKFTLELEAEAGGGSVLKRLCVPNSWAGDYGRYARMVAAAQEFFGRSDPAAGGPGRRF